MLSGTDILVENGHIHAVLLLVLTSASLALRERNPFFALVGSSAFGFPLPLPFSFRQILDELDACARFDGADVEGSGAEVCVDKLENIEAPGMELGRFCVSISECGGSTWRGTGTGREMGPKLVDFVASPVGMWPASGADVPADVAAPEGEDTDEDESEWEGEISGGTRGPEAINSICSSSSSLTTSTLSTVASTSASNSKTASGPAVKLELSALFLTLAKLVPRKYPGRVGMEVVGDAVSEKSQESIVPWVVIVDWWARRSWR